MGQETSLLNEILNSPFASGIFVFVGIVTLALEIFVPSGGILGLLAIASGVFGVYTLFHQGHPIVATGVIIFFIASLWGAFRFMMHRLSFRSALTPDMATSVDARIADLVGREGVTLTALRPAGMAVIDGRKVDVVTLGDFIERDVPIRVVDISGNRVVVRQMESRSNPS